MFKLCVSHGGLGEPRTLLTSQLKIFGGGPDEHRPIRFCSLKKKVLEIDLLNCMAQKSPQTDGKT